MAVLGPGALGDPSRPHLTLHELGDVPVIAAPPVEAPPAVEEADDE